MDSTEPLLLSAFCYPNENLDPQACAPASAGRSTFLWVQLPEPNRTRLLRVLSRLVERQLQVVAFEQGEVARDEFHGFNVPKPDGDASAVVGHAI